MFKTEQENFWNSDFGNDYIARNNTPEILKNKKHLFKNIFKNIDFNIKSIIEFGANIGLNLNAIESVITNSPKITAVEINLESCKFLNKNKNYKVINDSILNYDTTTKNDFVLTMGLLIHLDPSILNDVYDILYNTSSKYICIAEYYNPTPISIDYRGEKNKLFKRDFAGEMLDKYSDLELINYGFIYHKDPNYPLDDISWFILRKKDQ